MRLDTDLSLKLIRDVAGNRVTYSRGEDYYTSNRVKDVKLWKTAEEEQLVSYVSGHRREPYTTGVCIEGTDEVTGYDCTCPAFASNGVCKHIVALLLYRFHNREERAYQMMMGSGPFDDYDEDEDDNNDYDEDDDFLLFHDDDDYGTRRELLIEEMMSSIIGPYFGGISGTDKAIPTKAIPTKAVSTKAVSTKAVSTTKAVPTNHYLKSLINRSAFDDFARISAEKNVRAVPKLELYGGSAFLRITVGKSRQYVVKNIESFCTNIMTRSEVKYGKELEFIHHIEAFEPESQPLVSFILRKLNERNEYASLNNRSSYGYGALYGGLYGPEGDKKNLKLMPSAMDELFDLMVGGKIETGSLGMSGKPAEFLEGTPPCYLEIKELSGQKGFLLTLPDCEYILGEDYIYVYCSEQCGFGNEQGLINTVSRCSRDFSRRLRDLVTVSLNSRQPLIISEDDMTSFYINVLAELKDVIALKGDPSILKKFAPDELQANIYLDSPQNDVVMAAVKFQYGEVEFDPSDDDSARQENKVRRDEKAERRVNSIMGRYFKHYDPQRRVLFIQGDDELIYQFITEGFDEISNLGQIFVSDRFKNIGVKRVPQTAVGVRLESDLLHITMDTKEFPLDEAMNILAQYRQKRRYYRMRDGSFLKLDDTGFSDLAEMVEGLGLSQKELSKGEIVVPKYRALYLDHLLKGSDNVTFERDKHFKSLVKNMKSIDDSESSVPESLESVMREYQKDGYRWLAAMESYGFGGILADDMGLGKTLQIISLLLSRKVEGQSCLTLVVCPASLVLNWQNEIQKFAPRLRVLANIGTLSERRELFKDMDDYDVIVTSYDLLKRDVEQYQKIEFHYQIIDEAQYIKNQGTQNAKAVKAIKSKQRFALTGTPIENRLSELWSIFDFLMPGYLYSYKKFKDRYETDIVKSGDAEKIAMLGRQVAPFILRRLKSKVLKELPEKVETVIYAQMEGEQKKLYQSNLAKAKADIHLKIKEDGFENSKLVILALLTRLRQICCHPALCYEGYHSESAKLEACMELLLEATSAGHKVLLFSQFTSMLELIEKRIRREGLSYCLLTGATQKVKRMEMVEQFNEDDTQIFLISLKAGGTGLNLTAADVVIHFDPWWNIAAQNQATDRTHRIGQKKSVQVYKLIEKGTLEEKIMMLQETKKDLADAVIKAESSGFQTLTQNELMELLSM